METVVRLRRGWVARALVILLETDPDHASTVVAPRVLTAFSRGLRAGLFGGDAATITLDRLNIQEEEDGWSARWELQLPRLRPETFAPLVDMTRVSVPAARKLEIREAGPAALLVVRDFAAETEPTLRDLAWRLGFAPAARPRVRLSFHTTPGARTAGLITEALDAWTEIVRLGAFPARGRSAGIARPLHLAWPHPMELVFELDELACSSWAWEALFEALHVADPEGTVASVEIGAPAGLFEDARKQRPDSQAATR
jgi:hypothetical protein